jgi:hypothetical protein
MPAVTVAYRDEDSCPAVADHESGARGAWFKDPDGNILQIGQYGN